MTVPRILCLGRRGAGDDTVGLCVADRLRALGIAASDVADMSDIVECASNGGRVVVVDAVVGPLPPGTVWWVAPEELTRSARPVAHGLDAMTAIQLARELATTPLDIRVLGIAIEPTCCCGDELTPVIAAAVDRAVALARATQCRGVPDAET